MPGLTVSCPVAALDFQIRDKNPYEKIYKEIVGQVEQECITAIQLYPAAWPRRLKITVKENELKTEILVKGLQLFGKTVEFEDDSRIMTKVIVKDGSAEWSDEIFEALISEYAEVIRVEKEMIIIEGAKTNCTTGARYVYAHNITKTIPPKLDVLVDGKVHYLSVWYRGQSEQTNANTPCAYCGSAHRTEECTHKKKVCFSCKGEDHTQKDCPENKGVKQDDKTLIFYNGKCCLNNWSTEYPFRIGGQEYICVEQYVTEEKAYNFGDSAAAQKVRETTDPREMKRIGENIHNYDHQEWLNTMNEVVFKALKAKFTDERAHGAKDYLLSTGNRVIGEASRNTHWGTGLHVSDQNALKTDEWKGKNIIGKMLMNIRNEILEKNKNSEKKEKKSNVNESSQDNPRFRWAVVFGDSNVPTEIEEDISEIPVKIKNLSRGGMKLDDVGDVAKTCMLPKGEVDCAILHVGTCEWHYESEIKDADIVYADFIQSLNEISIAYPTTEYIISGIPLRDPVDENASKAKKINTEITKVNQKLEKFANEQTNVTFVDNRNIFISEEGEFNHYKNSVHLNTEGSQILLGNLRRGIREGTATSMMSTWSEAGSVPTS